MKGLVFTELLDMAEAVIGEEALDAVLDRLALDNDGAFTAVGNYPCSDLVRIVAALSEETGLPGAELQRRFGIWMMGRFAKNYGQFFADKQNALQMLDAIEDEVHVEVRKLYPDAELPRFTTRWEGESCLHLTYRSPRPLVAFCGGLVEACLMHFGQAGEITRTEALADGARFTVRLTG